MKPQDIDGLNQKLVQKYKKEFDAFLISHDRVEVKGPGGREWRTCEEDGDDWTWDPRSAEFMEFRIKTETTSTELFSSTSKDEFISDKIKHQKVDISQFMEINISATSVRNDLEGSKEYLDERVYNILKEIKCL